MKRFGAHGRETARTVLADAHDPASQLRERWPVGLRVIRKRWLELADALVKPLEAGRCAPGESAPTRPPRHVNTTGTRTPPFRNLS